MLKIDKKMYDKVAEFSKKTNLSKDQNNLIKT
jgi:hypothetical protein